MPKCRTPTCHRRAVLEVRDVEGVYHPGEEEISMCVACTRAYKLGHGRAVNEFTYDILDNADSDDLDKIKEVLMNG